MLSTARETLCRKAELQKAEIGRLSATNALGCGSQLGYERPIEEQRRNQLAKKIRLEIAVNDDFEEKAIAAITTAARTEPSVTGKFSCSTYLAVFGSEPEKKVTKRLANLP